MVHTNEKTLCLDGKWLRKLISCWSKVIYTLFGNRKRPLLSCKSNYTLLAWCKNVLHAYQYELFVEFIYNIRKLNLFTISENLRCFSAAYWTAHFGKEESVCFSTILKYLKNMYKAGHTFWVNPLENEIALLSAFFTADIHDLFQEKPGHFELAQQLTVSCILFWLAFLWMYLLF